MTDPRSVAVPEDDDFHPLDPSEWWQIETVWFAFTVPEKALNCVIYLIIRPSMGVCALQVNIFDASGHEPWNNRYWRSLWHLPIPKSLRRLDMPEAGFRLDVVESLKEYRLRYEHANASFDVTWTALVPPRMSPGGDHIDQFGRVRGELVLDGEHIAVDCYQMRDRSWKRRSDLEGRMGSYTYALASPQSALLMTSTYDGDCAYAPAGTGWLLRDGRFSPLAEAVRRVTARGPAGQPLSIELEGRDEEGRDFFVSGQSVSRSVMHTSGNILAWDSLMRWELGGQSCWGEDQDVMTPQSWGDFRTFGK
ncbi:MAG: hypothetical protein M0R03_03230 [Novosphingobium sp.]|nr:hypothetical protein [Novosphingobium sp.]